ncbi:MAG: right-handed parallel beta-helix repeat-containing protein [Candidatus Hodarchaeota archaeon]
MNHPTIFLEGNAALDAFPNKTGSGNATDPYVIQGLEIDAGGNGSCILLNNTNRSLIIKECTLSGSQEWHAGIEMNNCSNVEIMDCTIENNGANGIKITESTYVNLTRNLIEWNQEGGAWVFMSLGIRIVENTITNNNGGLGLVCAGMTDAFFSSGLRFIHEVVGNDINYNRGTGIFLASDYTRIANNSISYNGGYGLVILFGENNVISQNAFIKNSEGCFDAGHYDNDFYNNECDLIRKPIWYFTNWILPPLIVIVIILAITMIVKYNAKIKRFLSKPDKYPLPDESFLIHMQAILASKRLKKRKLIQITTLMAVGIVTSLLYHAIDAEGRIGINTSFILFQRWSFILYSVLLIPMIFGFKKNNGKLLIFCRFVVASISIASLIVYIAYTIYPLRLLTFFYSVFGALLLLLAYPGSKIFVEWPNMYGIDLGYAVRGFAFTLECAHVTFWAFLIGIILFYPGMSFKSKIKRIFILLLCLHVLYLFIVFIQSLIFFETSFSWETIHFNVISSIITTSLRWLVIFIVFYKMFPGFRFLLKKIKKKLTRHKKK